MQYRFKHRNRGAFAVRAADSDDKKIRTCESHPGLHDLNAIQPELNLARIQQLHAREPILKGACFQSWAAEGVGRSRASGFLPVKSASSFATRARISCRGMMRSMAPCS